MARKKKRDPDQGDIFDRKTTYEECKEAKGNSWKGDSSLGTKGGKTLGWCHKTNGWVETEGDDDA